MSIYYFLICFFIFFYFCCLLPGTWGAPVGENAVGAEGIFGICQTHVGCDPVSGSTLIKALCRTCSVVGWRTNKTMSICWHCFQWMRYCYWGMWTGLLISEVCYLMRRWHHLDKNTSTLFYLSSWRDQCLLLTVPGYATEISTWVIQKHFTSQMFEVET